MSVGRGSTAMKRWIVILVALGLTGCTSAQRPSPAVAPAAPPSAVDQSAAEQPGSGRPASGEPAGGQPAVQAAARVTAIVVTDQRGEQRFTAESKNQALTSTGPLTLRAQMDGTGPSATVEWYFEGMLAQGWGEVPAAARGLRRLGEGPEVNYEFGQGTQGELWVAVWGERSPAGRAGWRSFTIYPRIPLAAATECPPIHMPPPPANPVRPWRDTVVNPDGNSLMLNWLEHTFLVPLSADPSTCADPYVAAQLRDAQVRK